MKHIRDLNAVLRISEIPGVDVLVIDCPCGHCGGRIRIYIGPVKQQKPKQIWKATGNLDALTLEPSVAIPPLSDNSCLGWHGFIRNGIARAIGE